MLFCSENPEKAKTTCIKYFKTIDNSVLYDELLLGLLFIEGKIKCKIWPWTFSSTCEAAFQILYSEAICAQIKYMLLGRLKVEGWDIGLEITLKTFF